ncbi:MAG: glycine--tRNA ligase [Patescibacteria group bacterium]
MDDIVSLAKRRGFLFPSSEIYGGLANSWDYGPLGTLLKNNIKNEWIKFFVTFRDDVVLLDSSILQNSKVWEASGHIEHFHDPLVDCLKCKKRFRVDQMLEQRLNIKAEGLKNEEMDKLIQENNLKCEACGGNFTSVRNFNMMFKTTLGSLEDNGEVVFLRPETAQGIFTNFDNILKSNRIKIPFGIAQIGKVFRNEITAGNFIFRTLEFEQLELEYFVNPKDADKYFDELLKYTEDWYKYIGINEQNLKYVELDSNERAHYSKKTTDIYFKYPFGFKELESFANRGDYDLTRHSQASGKNLSYNDQDKKESFIPFVIEPSIGLDRLILALLSNGYSEEEINGRKRIFLKLSYRISPYQVGIFPLLRDGKIDKLALDLYSQLRYKYRVVYDDAGSIGKRYRRQDEIGTPKCITFDVQTLDDKMVTIRDRDTTAQDRIKIKDIDSYLNSCFI